MDSLTVEDKAKKIVDRFLPLTYHGAHLEQAKAAALICVDEMIREQQHFFALYYSKTIDFDITHAYSKHIKYWQSVRTEIEKL